ncbi:uncharacterized protein BCR38DRAFT_351380 [Pseudomassariella vexata]|uniref:FAD-binding PCMH-type domain-containing protein n=1 Tax=Pseudomassariella vexata TaxID=1141098 RepID=A0A1Y2DJK8_9PEZI|nr:uncharacterized protein BCR38DRAFT_351380 [Pseudomassariella vexata]ORY59448.1 hypothetical protein BCR38DRAFT_351380 [Pseudomassariella vexata]
MFFSYQAFLLASCIPVGFWASAQTIVVNDTKIAANLSTVAPAAEVISGNSGLLDEETSQLTDAVLANLTDLSLTNISLFAFADSITSKKDRRAPSESCKTYPGDASWPNNMTWGMLDLLTGGALIKTVPIASPCYNNWGNYDAARCKYVTDKFSNVSLHLADPSSVMFPLWEGTTCMPTADMTESCTLGGYPSYIVNVTKVAQMQLAVNFARNQNLRLVIKNTGHDFLGRSSGAGALSVWTNHFKSIVFEESYTATDYSGPAIKIGAGVENKELYEAAEKFGVTAVGGLCTTVGVAGGYIAGGGHSPMSPHYGMGADQVLSLGVVTADGRFVTADATQNQDLFWALRGGGPSSYGIVTSATLKVYPKLPAVAIMKFSFTASSAAAWEAIKAYWQAVPSFIDDGHYMYWNVIPLGNGTISFGIYPWFAPNTTTEQLKNYTAPLFATFASYGVDVTPTYQEFTSYLPAWHASTDAEAVSSITRRSTSRLFPREYIEDATKFNQTFTALKSIIDLGGVLVGYGITGGPANVSIPDNAVNPAWRDTALFVIPAVSWGADLSREEVAAFSMNFTNSWLQPLRDASPGVGAYANEGDIMEPDFQQSFWGTPYERLYAFKRSVDPTGLFYAHEGVGSEDWYVTGQLEGLPTQNGKLCRV